MAVHEIMLYASGLLAGIYLVLSVVRSLRRQPGVGGGQALIIVLAMLLACAAVGMDSLAHPSSTTMPVIPLGLAVVLVIGGLIVAVLERMRGATNANHSAGVVGVGAGVLLLAFLLARPVIFGQLLTPILGSRPTTAIIRSASDVELVSAPAKQRMFSNVVISTPIPYLTPIPMTPTETPTPYVYQDPLATGEATALASAEAAAPVDPASCSALVTLNLNLRETAGADGKLLTTIPFDSVIPVEGLNANGTWIRTRFQDKSGWVSVQYVTLKDGCGSLPTIK